MDRSAFGIPGRAWAVAIAGIVLAFAAAVLVPGPAVEGCLYAKGCDFNPRAPVLVAAAVLALGSALSIWIGAVPRHWVAGWTATISGIVGLGVALLIALATPYALTSNMRIWALAGGLCFFSAWVLQMPLGLIAASLPSPFRPRLPVAEPMRDDRPRWKQDVDATLAMLGARHAPMTAAEIQQVAELSFALGNDPRAPVKVHRHADRLRTLLASALEGVALRNAVELELRQAAVADAASDPYRLA